MIDISRGYDILKCLGYKSQMSISEASGMLAEILLRNFQFAERKLVNDLHDIEKKIGKYYSL
jgi:hypothetical protein